MKNLIISAIILILLSLIVNAQGKKYSNKEHGYNFIAPAGWTVKEEGGKCPSFTFTNSDQTIAIIVSTAHSLSLAEFLKNEYKVLESGYYPQGKVQENNGVQAVRLIKNQTTLDTVLMPLGENDAVAVMALIAGETHIQEAHNAVTQILKSVKLGFGRKLKKVFTDTEKALAEQSNRNGSSNSSSGSVPNSAWGRMLSGKKLEYFKNGSSSGSSRIFRFCGGRFSQNSQSLNSSQIGSGSINNSFTGSWDVRGNTLVLRYSDGDTAEYELSQGEDTNVVRLDGAGYGMSQADCS